MGKKDSGLDRDLFAFATGLDEQEGERKGSHSKRAFSVAEKTSDGAQVSMADLTSVLEDETGFANLKRRVGDITNAELPGKSAGKTRIEIVAAPLAAHEQERAERQAARELYKKDVNKWVPIIRANRNAKNLSFPIQPAVPSTEVQETLSSNFEPKNEMEQKIASLLQKSGMGSEEGLIGAEKLEMNKLTTEEVEKRYRELAKKRALLFYSERKLKQQSKIKSKSFRKQVKKEKLRREAKEEHDATEEEERETRVKAEMERIKERMTLKTRKASKWAHELLQKRRVESGGREEIMQQVRDKDRLRQEIFGKAAEYAEEAGDNSETDFDEQDEAHFNSQEADGNDEESLTEESDKEASKKTRSARKSTRFADDIGSDEMGETDEEVQEKHLPSDEMDSIFTENQPASDKPVGRRTFLPENPINKANGTRSGTVKEEKTTSGSPPLAVSQKEAKGRTAGSLPKKLPTETKTAAEIKSLFEAEDQDAINMDEKTRAQLDLIKKAFAGDDVFAEFERKKQADVEAEAPKDVDLTLPGWGSWGGIGIEVPKGKVILKAKAGEGIDPRKRKDAGLRHVIIYERRSKKAAKLMVEKPPFPYRTHEEYERSLSQPGGREWNSATSFAKKTKPRVQVKVGSIIDAISFVKERK